MRLENISRGLDPRARLKVTTTQHSSIQLEPDFENLDELTTVLGGIDEAYFIFHDGTSFSPRRTVFLLGTHTHGYTLGLWYQRDHYHSIATIIPSRHEPSRYEPDYKTKQQPF